MAWKTDIYFSLFWSLGSSRSRCQQIQCLVRACFLVHRQRPSSPSSPFHPHRMEGGRELFGVSFIGALIPFMRALPSRPNHQSSHLQISSLWRLGVNIWILRGHKPSGHTTKSISARIKSARHPLWSHLLFPSGHLLLVALVSGVSAQHQVCSMSDGEHTIVSHQPYYPPITPAGSLAFCSCTAFWEEDR